MLDYITVTASFKVDAPIACFTFDSHYYITQVISVWTDCQRLDCQSMIRMISIHPVSSTKSEGPWTAYFTTYMLINQTDSPAYYGNVSVDRLLL